MTKVYNVWLDVEEFDEKKEMDAHDIDTIRLAQFKTPTDAVVFHDAVIKMAMAVVKQYPGQVKKKEKKE